LLQGRIVDLPGKTKISEFKCPIMDKNVLWLNIAVDEAGVMQNAIAFGDLFEYFPYLMLGHEHHTFEVVLQRPPVAVLHNDVEIVTAFHVHSQTVHQVLLVRQFPNNRQF
jgi:hypothetical protein